MKRFFVLAVFIASCSSAASVRDPLYHSPLASSRWKPLTPRSTPRATSPESSPDSAEEETLERRDIRARMIAEAERLLKSGSAQGGFGAEDLEQVLTRVDAGVDWRANAGLESLVSLARKKDAYHTGTKPTPGDIVLFHNQLDADLDGEFDDWLTGGGVVVDRRGARFTAVVRTGHAPRRITAWPDGPAQRVLDGELVNSYLRVPSRADPNDSVYLAGQLYAGHIDIEQLVASSDE